MSWRIVVIANRCKLDYCMNYMVVRGEETLRILLDEIAVLVIENNAVAMTGCLLSALISKKVKVILCDNARNPQAELVPYYGAHNDSLRIKQQLLWQSDIKQTIWTAIVKEKISNQALLLKKYQRIDASDLLYTYIKELKQGDTTNREGHAAKVYFNALFGKTFSRNDEENPINSALNYGYAILLSAINREITASGYLTQLGLAHDNQFNHFNLSCDLMEPLRIIVDDAVCKGSYEEFGTKEKHSLLQILNKTYLIKGNEQILMNAIKIYVKSIFDALNEENESLIRFIKV